MDLTPVQRRLVFVVVVLALVVLGIFVIHSRSSNGGTAAAPTVSASTSAPAPTSSASYVPPTVVPSATPSSTVGGAEIYQWLPFTAADLAAAAQATTSFAAAYTTWSYTEDQAAYSRTMSGLVTASYLTILAGEYNTSGVAGPRAADKQVSTGSGTIESISSFGSGSINFTVAVTQKVTSTQPATKVTGQYTVTVVSSGGSWEVNNLELTSQGNS